MKSFIVMRNIVLSTISTAVMIIGTFTNTSAQTLYYKQIDDCSVYYPGCAVWVIKCRHTGYEVCSVSEQVPCSEACGGGNEQ